MTPATRPPPTSEKAAHTAYADESSFSQHASGYLDVASQARERGLLQRTPWFYWCVSASLIAAFGGCLTGFLLLGDSWFQLLIAAALGLVFTQTAFLAHEAAHRQILSFGPGNDRLARILAAAVGLSYSWWHSKHSRHHGNPNRVGKDPDIEPDTIVFLAEDANRSKGLTRRLVAHQGWLFFPLLTLEGLNLHRHSIWHLISQRKVKGRWLELGMITARFGFLLIPLFVLLPLGMAFAFMGVQLAVFGVYMGASFAPNHKGMPVIAASAKLDFFSKQVRTSRNIRGGWWATWLMGGLNYQIEHHLFPSMPRPHLARARIIVQDYCTRHAVPYTETSLGESYRIVIRYLNRVGLGARDPFDCPVAAQFGRR